MNQFKAINGQSYSIEEQVNIILKYAQNELKDAHVCHIQIEDNTNCVYAHIQPIDTFININTVIEYKNRFIPGVRAVEGSAFSVN